MRALTAFACCGLLAATGASAADAKRLPRPDVVVRSTPQNVAWGGFPIGQTPVAKVKSGDVVRMDALSQSGLTNATLDPEHYFGLFGVQPGEILPDATAFWNSIPNRPRYGGGHILTGPIYVEGAEPGDTLEVQILGVDPRVPYGLNGTSATGGVFGTGYPGWREGDSPLDIPIPSADAPGGVIPQVTQHLYRTGKFHGKQVAYFNRDIKIPLQPFFGTMGVAGRPGVFVGRTPTDPPPPLGVQTSTAPGEYAGNLDVQDLSAGSTLYIPVFQPGAQFYGGDTHSAMGDGEVSGTAIEQSMTGTFRFIVHKKTTPMPSAEDKDFFYLFGIDHDLDRATRKATQAVIDFLKEQKGFSTADAFSFASIAVDFVNSEAVDGTQVITGKVPKDLFGQQGQAQSVTW
jgi:acetamidase/formamidase